MLNLYYLLESKTPAFLKQLIPQRWRIWLGYQLKVVRGRALSDASLKQPLRLPAGETEQSLFDYLAQFRIEGQEENQEWEHYLQEAFHRFLYTMQITPEGDGRLLEIGASPYFISLLLHRLRDYEVHYVNYFGPTFGDQASETLVGPGTRLQIDFPNVNIETHPLPYEEDSFDVVMLCEVLEHFTNDPIYALRNIKRVLKPGGVLILTTPNVNRLLNVARMITGHNIYDPYSGYGPYGRHNREYTWEELEKLLAYVGFDIEIMFTSDVHDNHTGHYMNPDAVKTLVSQRKHTLGQYFFIRARNNSPAREKRPEWLFRSYLEGEVEIGD
jgi:SAM-dependent methyltransferase